MPNSEKHQHTGTRDNWVQSGTAVNIWYHGPLGGSVHEASDSWILAQLLISGLWVQALHSALCWAISLLKKERKKEKSDILILLVLAFFSSMFPRTALSNQLSLMLEMSYTSIVQYMWPLSTWNMARAGFIFILFILNRQTWPEVLVSDSSAKMFNECVCG